MASTQVSASQNQLVPRCGTSTVSTIAQNDALHIAALFVVLGVSASAATFPILASRYPRLGIPHKLLFLLKHFGTGVLVATAFCHLLPTAFISLLDPCLQSYGPDGLPDGKGVLGLNGSYPALSGAIAMAGVFIVSSVEMVFAELVGGHQRHHHHRSDLADGVKRTSTFGKERNIGSLTGSPVGSKIMGNAVMNDGVGKPSETTLSPPGLGRVVGGSSVSRPESSSGAVEAQVPPTKEVISEDDDETLDLERQKERDKKAVLQCMLLEMGILFHSVFIGLALR
ncbi:hypothetical protein FRC02_001777 [Tulasnella sp. 418]|nr:hypothetical protein FRC02_001777 [Tulasnella sp. 418]